ncbi:MAG: NAD(P)/FAD-dependent oxidoreductase [Bacteroidota bacterium]
MKQKHKILIIGAGAAGLAAGHALAQRGIDFQILEASDRIGGRLGKIEDFADFPLDMGAQWLHGKKSLMGKLIKDTKTKITKDKSKARYWFRNQLVKEPPIDVWEMFEEEGLPDISYQEYAAQRGLGEDYQYILEGVAGDFGASPSNLSAYWKIKEEENWSSGGKDYKFERTYFDLLNEHFALPIMDRIQLNTPVVEINYEGKKIKVQTANQTEFVAEKLIIAVPISILKAGDIQFTPALPNAKTEAFAKIGMEAGMKVFFKFAKAFYHQAIMGGKFCAAYVDEKMGKAGKDHVLLAFIMGQQAKYLHELPSERAIIRTLLAELDEMYDYQASAHFIKAKVINWMAEPYIRGAYSYSTVGMGNARSIAAQPLAGKIFFAGEAMNLNGHHQTVHGAVETGQQAVEEILGK